MTFPEVERRISSPEVLTAILRDVKRCIADGTLRQIKRDRAPLAIDDVTKVPDEGPWPDYLEVHFEDRDGQQYRLTVETYHGTGGFWAKT
jgi:hypothetical protein